MHADRTHRQLLCCLYVPMQFYAGIPRLQAFCRVLSSGLCVVAELFIASLYAQ
jgi:hypothetical protein